MLHYKTTVPARIRSIAAVPLHASLALLAFCLVVYLPGLLRLPAVDRTEVIWAESTRDMVARGAWLDPRYGEKVHQYRPIGTFWAQGVVAKVAGADNSRNISVYRIPSLLAVSLAVLAVYWLGAGIVGAEASFIAAGLFAVAPLTVLLSQLAIAEGLSLLPAVVAMLALLRLYQADPESADATKRSGWLLALLFWVAVGLGVLVNALLVPILVLVTIIGLAIADRDVKWLWRTKPLLGLPIAIAIAAPWLVVRAHQDGTAFAGLSWQEFLAALGGAQDMKLRAWPGTFLLALIVGFLPGTALIGTVLREQWDERETRLAKFLLAWVLGYLFYLELLSSKPGTYMVQTMFPALALAIGRIVVMEDGSGTAPKWNAFVWPSASFFIPVLLFGAVHLFAGQIPDIPTLITVVLIGALFILATRQGREGQLRLWAATSVAGFALLAVALLGWVLPQIRQIWPAREIATLAARCPGAVVSVLGYREPSARFVLGSDVDQQSPDVVANALQGSSSALAIVESRWRLRALNAVEAKPQQTLAQPTACISAYNVMRGCPLRFEVYEAGIVGRCDVPAEFVCGSGKNATGPQFSKDCD